MDFNFSEEQQLLADTVQRFVRDTYSFESRREILKSKAGWTLRQPSPGTFLWTSPLGGRYEVQPEPVLPPLPETCPGPDDPWHDEAAPPCPGTMTMGRPSPPRSPPEPEPIDLHEAPPF